MVRRGTAVVLAAAALAAVMVLGWMAAGEGGTSAWAPLADVTPTAYVFLPALRLDPTPTPTAVPTCELYIQNDTGAQLCYEVVGTGIGRRCFSGGKHLYGTFPAGSYAYRVEAWCGSGTYTQAYQAGIWIETYECK
jgi:hypothetical protein